MKFSNNWFSPNIPTWDALIPQYSPQRILEIGSFEGQSICHLIQLMGNTHPLEIHCLDTWQGGQEHADLDMESVENVFDRNVGECIGTVAHPVNVTKIKARSDVGLCHLVAQGKVDYFDMIYIDGSHETPDVLSDAVLSFRLLKVGGLMIFDDYLWGLGEAADPLMNAKMAIDNFINCFQRKMQPHPWLPNSQLYCRKLQN